MTVASSTSATPRNMAASSASDICFGTCPTNSLTLSLLRPGAPAPPAAAGCCCSLSPPSSAIGVARVCAGWGWSPRWRRVREAKTESGGRD
uniref:Pco079656 n=1 Tax=Arundo donax TaxID=35708 RepID=A0A0A9DA71_ARUDO